MGDDMNILSAKKLLSEYKVEIGGTIEVLTESHYEIGTIASDEKTLSLHFHKIESQNAETGIGYGFYCIIKVDLIGINPFSQTRIDTSFCEFEYDCLTKELGYTFNYGYIGSTEEQANRERNILLAAYTNKLREGEPA